MERIVAVIGPAHALKGEARLEIRTDDPRGRLAVGNELSTEPATAGPLTVRSLRYNGQRWYAAFEQAPDRTAIEALRGVTLLIDVDEDDDDEDEGWYADELIGLAAYTPDGQHLGRVVDLEPGVAQDRLVVLTEARERIAVPFVEEIVPDIDEEAGRLTIDPPGGLFPGIGTADVVPTHD